MSPLLFLLPVSICRYRTLLVIESIMYREPLKFSFCEQRLHRRRFGNTVASATLYQHPRIITDTSRQLCRSIAPSRRHAAVLSCYKAAPSVLPHQCLSISALALAPLRQCPCVIECTLVCLHLCSVVIHLASDPIACITACVRDSFVASDLTSSLSNVIVCFVTSAVMVILLLVSSKITSPRLSPVPSTVLPLVLQPHQQLVTFQLSSPVSPPVTLYVFSSVSILVSSPAMLQVSLPVSQQVVLQASPPCVAANVVVRFAPNFDAKILVNAVASAVCSVDTGIIDDSSFCNVCLVLSLALSSVSLLVLLPEYGH